MGADGNCCPCPLWVDVASRVDEPAELATGHRRSFDPEPIDADAMNWRLFGIMLVGSHAEGAAGNPDHVLRSRRGTRCVSARRAADGRRRGRTSGSPEYRNEQRVLCKIQKFCIKKLTLILRCFLYAYVLRKSGGQNGRIRICAGVNRRAVALASQDAQLRAAGCAKVYAERVSGSTTDRPELAKVLRRLEAGDVLV